MPIAADDFNSIQHKSSWIEWRISIHQSHLDYKTIPASAAAAIKPAGAMVCIAAAPPLLLVAFAVPVPEAGEPEDSVTTELLCVAVTTTVAATEEAETWL